MGKVNCPGTLFNTIHFCDLCKCTIISVHVVDPLSHLHAVIRRRVSGV